MRIMDAIADPDLPLLVSRSRTGLCEALGAVSPDRHRPDLYDETSTYCHVLDCLRYFLVNQPTVRCEWIPVDYDSLPSPRMFS